MEFEDEEMDYSEEMELLVTANEMEVEEGYVEGDSEGPVSDTRTTISYSEWERPQVPSSFDPKTTSLSFQQLDMDHYIGKPVRGMPGPTIGPVPVIRSVSLAHITYIQHINDII